MIFEGVHVPDVRWTVFFGPPKALSDFLQMGGRAGRDGFKALLIYYHSLSRKRPKHVDDILWDFLTNQTGTSISLKSKTQRPEFPPSLPPSIASAPPRRCHALEGVELLHALFFLRESPPINSFRDATARLHHVDPRDRRARALPDRRPPRQVSAEAWTARFLT